MTLTFDKSIYDKRALLKTAFSFCDHIYIHLSQDTNNWIVNWVPKGEADISTKEFENEMISQMVRIHVLEDNKEIRLLMLARAMASTIVEDSEIIENLSSTSDDREILRNWFTK